MTPSTETWLISTISKRLERIAEGKEPMAEDRALTLLSILKDVAGDIPSLSNLPQHVKEWLEAAINARLDAIAEKREIAAEDRIATLTEALAALRPPASPGGAVELVDTGVGLSGGPITTTGTISLSTSSQQAIARANTSVQPEDLAAVATSGNYADLSNTPTIPEQFNPIQGANMLITGTYPNITFSAVAGEEFTPVWGEIQGTLSDQTDLQTALNAKASLAGADFTGTITVPYNARFQAGVWANVSGSGGGSVLFGNNATIGVDDQYRYVHTHGGIGASGILLTGSADAGPWYFDTGDNATTAGQAFTPTLRKLWHSGDFDPNTKVGTAGNWDMSGNLAMRAGTLQVYRAGQSTPGVEIGAGWDNPSDGIGWIVNRGPEVPLRLAGRNEGVVLSVGEFGALTTLTGELLATGPYAGLAAADRVTGSKHTIYGENDMLNVWRAGAGNVAGFRYDGIHSFSGWVRTYGNTGWYSQTHGGGWYMEDNVWIRNYGLKRLMVNSQGGSEGDVCLSSVSPTIRFHDTDHGTNQWLHCNDGQIGFLANNSWSWAAHRTATNDWACVGGVIASASDARLKTNRRKVPDDVLDRFFDTEVVMFDWDEEKFKEYNIQMQGGKDVIGVYAQELQKNASNVVKINPAHNTANGDSPDILTVDWVSCIPYLMAEIKRLRKRVAELEGDKK